MQQVKSRHVIVWIAFKMAANDDHINECFHITIAERSITIQ